jgi:hypothetical protein
MGEKILILNRSKNTLEIQDEDDEFSYSYMVNITHLKKGETQSEVDMRIFDVFNGCMIAGYVANVKEIKEEW